ncbi:hypothetical protein [Kitasatospora sp. NPDC094015]|uniref:hypothetical protein n=1 Tax=Kitasatospora sp. NPDC094015 TaxID=3155205 RepID=UPI00332A1A6E
MRTAVRTILACTLLGAVAPATTGAAAAAEQPVAQHQSIPVLAVTDLGDLTTIANLGRDFAGLLGR